MPYRRQAGVAGPLEPVTADPEGEPDRSVGDAVAERSAEFEPVWRPEAASAVETSLTVDPAGR